MSLTRRKLLALTIGAPMAAGVAVAGVNWNRLQDAVADLRPPAAGLPAGFSDRLAVNGRPFFWAGVNYPWKTGQDFGTGGWGHTGVSEPTTYQEVDADFANMAAQGVRVVKWRVFSDGRYSPTFAEDGTVTGLGDTFFKDLDAALEIATRHDLYLVLTLLSSGFWTADCRTGDVQLGGHAATLSDPTKRRTLVQQGIVPVLQRVTTSNRVIAFEIVAEPEWGVGELHSEDDARIKLPLSVVRDFVAESVRAIHRHSRALATVESNRFSNMQAWQGLNLDFFSFSWYDWLEPYEPLATPATTAKLDRPVVLGEYPAGGSVYYGLTDVLDVATSMGYAGAFAWSYWGGDGLSKWRSAAAGYTHWVRDRWDTVGLDGAIPPSDSPVAEQAYPYAFDGLVVRTDGPAVVAELKIDVPSGEPYVPHGYLYEVGSTRPLEDVRLTAAPGKPGRLEARFSAVDAITSYTVSLGIFDRAGTLKKWFGNVATFAVQDGALVTPKIDTLATELGCKS
jgi:hypothetical protein